MVRLNIIELKQFGHLFKSLAIVLPCDRDIFIHSTAALQHNCFGPFAGDTLDTQEATSPFLFL
jgi:hypothetical protein